MSIHKKLLLILLTVSLPPLLIISWFDQQAASRLLDHFTGHRYQVLTQQIDRRLAQLVTSYGVVLDNHRKLAEITLAAQVWELEDRLRAVPAAAGDPAPGDRPAERAVDSGRTGGRTAAGRERVRDSARPSAPPAERRAPDVMSVLARPLDFPPGLGGETYAGRYVLFGDGTRLDLASGKALSPRRGPSRQWRDWFDEARSQDGPMWLVVPSDGAGRPPMMTVSMPLRRVDGAAVGVTAIDVTAHTLMAGLDVPADMPTGTRLFLFDPNPSGVGTGDALPGRVLAAAGGGEATDAPLATLGPAAAAAVRASPATDVHRLAHDGREHLVAAVPAGGLGPLLVAAMPADDLLSGFADITEEARQRREHQLMIAAVSLMLMLVIAVVLSIIAARSITQPIEVLATAARRLAEGDLDARADVDTNDEMEELAATFNGMVPKLQDRLRMRAALGLAMEVQQKLLPAEPPRLPGIDLHGVSIYCDETGGDYFDFLELSALGGQRVGVAVGDVTGHGIAAALLMATARALLRSRASQAGDLSQVMTEINRHIAGDAHAGRFMTLFYGVLDADAHTFRWVSAGHAPALLYDPASDSFSEFPGHDIPLGVEPHWIFREDRRDGWSAGEVIAIGTDGIWETRNEAGEMFGIDNLCHVIRGYAAGSAREICEGVVQALAGFRGRRHQDDDVTLVIVKLEGTAGQGEVSTAGVGAATAAGAADTGRAGLAGGMTGDWHSLPAGDRDGQDRDRIGDDAHPGPSEYAVPPDRTEHEPHFDRTAYEPSPDRSAYDGHPNGSDHEPCFDRSEYDPNPGRAHDDSYPDPSACDLRPTRAAADDGPPREMAGYGETVLEADDYGAAAPHALAGDDDQAASGRQAGPTATTRDDG